MTPRFLRGMAAVSVLFGTVAGLSACGGGGKTSSPTAPVTSAASAPLVMAVTAPAAEPAATPPRTGGALPADLVGVVGSSPFIVVDQFGYLPGLKKVELLFRR